MPRSRFYVSLWLDLPVRALAAVLYRVRTQGQANVPVSGGAILVANHLSYADPILLQLACPRPLRFVGYQSEKSHRFFDWVFRTAGVIPISDASPIAGMRQAVRSLAAGEIVCLFLEGGISRTGQLMPLKKGFEVLARQAGVPVLAACVDGVWGSIFSFSGQKYLWKRPRLKRTPITVAIGPPRPAAEADADSVRQSLLELGAEAFQSRPVLERHLGREAVRALAKRPGRVVVIDRTGERREVKAAQLIGAAAALARWIAREIPEPRVGIVLPPGAGALVANLAVVISGKIPVNLNFTASRAAMEASLRLGGIGAVISADAVREKVPQFLWPERTYDLRAAMAAAGGKRAIVPWVIAAWLLPNQWVADLLGLPRQGGDKEAALLFTSGSGGDPKGVALTHRNLLANAEQVSSLSILPEDCVMLGSLPVFHSFGFTVTVWYPLLIGCGLVTVPSPLDTRRIAEAIASEKATVLVGAPTFLRPLLKKAHPEELRTLRVVVAGAEALPDDLEIQFRAVFQIDIRQGYGLTEASPVVSVNQPDPPAGSATAAPQKGGKSGTVGRLLPGIAVRLLDPDTGRDLPLTATGILTLKGANIFRGYLGHETATAENGGWFATGDLASLDQEGFLIIAGRLSRFSKIGGEMVPHGVVERTLVLALGLDESEAPVLAVAGIPDPQKGEALVVLAAIDLTVDAVRRSLQARGLPALWTPKHVVRVERIPLLGTGKLDLAGCRKLALTGVPR